MNRRRRPVRRSAACPPTRQPSCPPWRCCRHRSAATTLSEEDRRQLKGYKPTLDPQVYSQHVLGPPGSSNSAGNRMTQLKSGTSDGPNDAGLAADETWPRNVQKLVKPHPPKAPAKSPAFTRETKQARYRMS